MPPPGNLLVGIGGGALLGGILGGLFMVGKGQKRQKAADSAPALTDSAPAAAPAPAPAKASKELQAMLEKLDAFQNLPEYAKLEEAIVALEMLDQDTVQNPKKYSRIQIQSDASRYANRAERMLQALLNNKDNAKKTNPLDLDQDVTDLRKVISDLKANLFQQAGLV